MQHELASFNVHLIYKEASLMCSIHWFQTDSAQLLLENNHNKPNFSKTNIKKNISISEWKIQDF